MLSKHLFVRTEGTLKSTVGLPTSTFGLEAATQLIEKYKRELISTKSLTFTVWIAQISKNVKRLIFNTVSDIEIESLAVKPPPQYTSINHTPDTLKKLETLKQLALLSFTEVEKYLSTCTTQNESIFSSEYNIYVQVAHLKKMLDPS